MKKLKISRNLWLFASLCFLLTFVINLVANTIVLLPVLNGITCILCFINVYINHKKIVNGS